MMSSINPLIMVGQRTTRHSTKVLGKGAVSLWDVIIRSRTGSLNVHSDTRRVLRCIEVVGQCQGKVNETLATEIGRISCTEDQWALQ